jgi:hypothetical protein
MDWQKFKEIVKKYNLVKKDNGEYTLPDVHPSDFLIRLKNDGTVNMAGDIKFYQKASWEDIGFEFEFSGCNDIEDFRVELKLQYIIKSYKLMKEHLKLERIKQDF